MARNASTIKNTATREHRPQPKMPPHFTIKKFFFVCVPAHAEKVHQHTSSFHPKNSDTMIPVQINKICILFDSFAMKNFTRQLHGRKRKMAWYGRWGVEQDEEHCIIYQLMRTIFSKVWVHHLKYVKYKYLSLKWSHF